MIGEEDIKEIREIVSRERKIMREFNSLLHAFKGADPSEKRMITSQTEKLKLALRETNDKLSSSLSVISIPKHLKDIEKVKSTAEIEEEMRQKSKIKQTFKPQKSKEKISVLDREIIKRLKKNKEKVPVKKEKKLSAYSKFANNLFANSVKKLVREKDLGVIEKDLIRSNLGYTPVTYISILILSTIVSFISAVFIAIFFMFFNLSPDLPIITRATEDFFVRLLKVFWIVFAVPAGTFLFMYVYPSLEKKSTEDKINIELPFAVIHMAAISSSMIEPIKVFNIICSTKEYPHLEREFNKLLNEINIYGYDLVTALRDLASTSPSTKLAELFNGLATTITSGGQLYEFFDKRAQSLLFEYRLDREKNTKSAETFMDIYISVVIATPMILMLLLMMMRISGLGISLSTSMITFLIVAGVALINIFFLVFLQLKRPEKL